MNVLHSLLEEGVDSSLADEEISPLYNHNADKEPRVTGVLQIFTLVIALQQQQQQQTTTTK